MAGSKTSRQRTVCVGKISNKSSKVSCEKDINFGRQKSEMTVLYSAAHQERKGNKKSKTKKLHEITLKKSGRRNLIDVPLFFFSCDALAFGCFLRVCALEPFACFFFICIQSFLELSNGNEIPIYSERIVTQL